MSCLTSAGLKRKSPCDFFASPSRCDDRLRVALFFVTVHKFAKSGAFQTT
jgi:hypothetical protein